MHTSRRSWLAGVLGAGVASAFAGTQTPPTTCTTRSRMRRGSMAQRLPIGPSGALAGGAVFFPLAFH